MDKTLIPSASNAELKALLDEGPAGVRRAPRARQAAAVVAEVTAMRAAALSRSSCRGCCRAAAPASAAVARQPVTHTVTIEAVAFSPPEITVKAGDSIVWVNKDPFPHTVTSQGGRIRFVDHAARSLVDADAVGAGRDELCLHAAPQHEREDQGSVGGRGGGHGEERTRRRGGTERTGRVRGREASRDGLARADPRPRARRSRLRESPCLRVSV